MNGNVKLIEKGATTATCPGGTLHEFNTDIGRYAHQHIYRCHKCGFEVAMDSRE